MRYTLFKSEAATSVRRFYHIDFYYFLLLAVFRGAKDELEAFVFFSKNESELLSIATNPNSKEKLKSEYIINSVIFESVAFGLIVEKNRQLHLTDQGEVVLNMVFHKDYKNAEIYLCHKTEEYYGRFSLLLNLMNEINPNSGLVLFPKPSPGALGFAPSQLLNEADLEKYCRKFSTYALNEIKRFRN